MLTVRPATRDDVPALAHCYYQMMAELEMLHDPLVEDWQQKFVQMHREAIEEDQAGWFVADGAATLAGCACALRESGAWTKMHRVQSGVIIGVYVAPEYRRRGLARRLTESCLRWFRARDIVRIRLQASPFARPLYESLGFRPGIEMRLDL